jgi:hypothetical protein
MPATRTGHILFRIFMTMDLFDGFDFGILFSPNLRFKELDNPSLLP